MNSRKLAIIGGGPAALAAAVSAKKNGIEDIIIIERDDRLGGILNQCIHSGFGLHVFGEELTGPEYADRYIELVKKEEIKCLTKTMVTELGPDKKITCCTEGDFFEIQADAIILATGCRERPRGALNIPGTRPAGIYSAGTAQRLMNIDGFSIGKQVVILGSGDIGLIMARRLTLEGAQVKKVVEIMPQPGGLKRNIAQCLDDFGIPLVLGHTITEIYGDKRITGVQISAVSPDLKPIPGTQEYIACDTLLLSVGLIPENELAAGAGISINKKTGGANVSSSLETEIPGIFACGNALHVHDLVDNVTIEAEKAGRYAAEYLKSEKQKDRKICIETDKPFERKKEPETDGLTCIGCPTGCTLRVSMGGPLKKDIIVEGNRCSKGYEYAVAEMTNPRRNISSTVQIEGGEVDRLPVRTAGPVPKSSIPAVMDVIHRIRMSAPVSDGSTVAENIAGTGINLIATKTVKPLNSEGRHIWQ